MLDSSSTTRILRTPSIHLCRSDATGGLFGFASASSNSTPNRAGLANPVGCKNSILAEDQRAELVGFRRNRVFAPRTLQTHLGANLALSVDDAFRPLREPFDDVQPAPCWPLLVGG
jgi:hypothetical protein